jgi:hypothetical protein
MIFGLHSELDTDPLYQPYFEKIEKWGRADVTGDFFLNDNRTPIRINAIIMLFSFGNYAVHALVMLVISFVGQFAFYKTFKGYFPGKEMLLAIIIFLTPSILFWTSGVLKEPIAMCLLGLFVYAFFKLFVHYQYRKEIHISYYSSFCIIFNYQALYYCVVTCAINIVCASEAISNKASGIILFYAHYCSYMELEF